MQAGLLAVTKQALLSVRPMQVLFPESQFELLSCWQHSTDLILRVLTVRVLTSMLHQGRGCAPSVDLSLVNLLDVGQSYGEPSMAASPLLLPGEEKSLELLKDWVSRCAELTTMCGLGLLSVLQGASVYEYVLVYSDDLLVVALDTDRILLHIDQHFKLKEGSVGIPDRYLGANIGKYTLADGSEAWYMSSEYYVNQEC